MPVRRTARAILPRLVFILLLGVFLAAPLPYRPPLFDVSGRAPFDDAPASSSAAQSRTYEFRLDRSRPDLTVRFSTRLSGGQVAFTLRDGDKSSATWGLIGRDSVQATFGFGREFRAGAYTLKVESKNARGEFRARVFGARPWQYHQKLYILLAAGALAFGLRLFVVKRRGDAAAPQAVILRYVVRLLLFGLGLTLLYPIIHEAGHALPMIAFGAFSLHGSDFIGAFGHPHVNYLPGADLQPWQYCLISLGGPLLPSVVGWLLFVLLGALKRGRSLGLTFEAALLWTSGLLMMGQAGALIPMLGLASDGDYTGFVTNLAAPVWAANLIQLALLAVNAVLIWRIAHRLLEIGRLVKARRVVRVDGA